MDTKFSVAAASFGIAVITILSYFGTSGFNKADAGAQCFFHSRTGVYTCTTTYIVDENTACRTVYSDDSYPRTRCEPIY